MRSRRSPTAPALLLGGAVDVLVEAVDPVLDALEALGDRPHAPGEALDVGGRGDVQRAHRDLLGLGGLLARLEGAGQRAVDQRVLEQVLGELAQRVLALPGQAAAQPFRGGLVRSSGAFLARRRRSPPRTCAARGRTAVERLARPRTQASTRHGATHRLERLGRVALLAFAAHRDRTSSAPAKRGSGSRPPCADGACRPRQP